ncbi:MAG: peptidoglycan recognition protein family protein [Porticoccaceae bacterium]|nr:peptidoglycan recognition protein family protein [Porticoccaceae bacterium]
MNRRKFLTTTAIATLGLAGGAFYWGKRWHYIVIHHSGGDYGTIEFLQQVHRERQAKDPVDAIPYHYVIGNGNGLKMGEVASDWRQKYDLWGMHVSGNNPDHNFRGIGICLIGNFENNPVPQEQFEALIRLTRQLMKKHSIPVSRVSGHGHTEGEHTKCPGKHFPMAQFLRKLA